MNFTVFCFFIYISLTVSDIVCISTQVKEKEMKR